MAAGDFDFHHVARGAARDQQRLSVQTPDPVRSEAHLVDVQAAALRFIMHTGAIRRIRAVNMARIRSSYLL
jgi:hypothetical protein